MLYMYGLVTFMFIATWTSAHIPKSMKYETIERVTIYPLTRPRVPKQVRMKYILQWTSPHCEPFSFWGQGQEEFLRWKCKIKDCYVTANRNLLENITDYDMVAFHAPEITASMRGPRWRSPHQKYVFFSMESSHNYPMCYDRFDNYFNWTWTYRLDSDLTYQYITVTNVTGHIIGPKIIMHWMNVDSMQPISNETKALLRTKSKLAAWFVSNCNSLSKRLNYVLRLRYELFLNYGLLIDIFGRCGFKKCPSHNMDDCLRMIQKKYYFYLSFENSFAEDYVTEKLLWALQNYAVPVVLGAANYTRFMPDGIYLHAGKMSPAALAKEMNDIINDKERYYSFFKWRNHYSYHVRDEVPDSDDHCRMCEMLHNEELMKRKSVYTHFRRWWNDYAKC